MVNSWHNSANGLGSMAWNSNRDFLSVMNQIPCKQVPKSIHEMLSFLLTVCWYIYIWIIYASSVFIECVGLTRCYTGYNVFVQFFQPAEPNYWQQDMKFVKSSRPSPTLINSHLCDVRNSRKRRLRRKLKHLAPAFWLVPLVSWFLRGIKHAFMQNPGLC